MAWKRLSFILIPHSRENIRQINIPRHVIYITGILLFIAILIMIFYIIGFKGKSFYYNRTKELENKNKILFAHLAVFDSSLAAMNTKVAYIESVNTNIINDSEFPERDIKLTKNYIIDNSKDGLKLPAQKIISIIDRMNRESWAFDKNFASLYKTCMDNTDFVKHIPSIRPAEGTLSKEFGRSYSKFSKTVKTHQGVDIHKEAGTYVVATADGIISNIDFSEELGYFIEIDHMYGYKTRYTHLQRPAQMEKKISLKVGDKVERGQQIGTIGETGILKDIVSAHIMYSVYHHGIPVDPVDFFFAYDFAGD